MHQLFFTRKIVHRVNFSSATSPLELTLAILKPDLVQHHPNLTFVQKMIVENNFLIVRSKILSLSRTKAEEFYKEHEGKFFYNRLVTFMSSGPCQPLVLAKAGAIADWRKLMGPTKVFKTRYSHPDSIRGRFGLTDTRNCSHGSDSPQTAKEEMDFFFPEFDVKLWELEEKIHFDNGNLSLDWDNFTHKPLH